MASSKSGKILMVIAAEQFRDEELLMPKQIFQDAGYETQIAACRLQEAKGMLGAVCKPDVLLKDVQAAEYDAAVVVGGMGSVQYLWDDADLHAILQAVAKAQRPVAAICLSGAVLAKAGLLRGKKATVWPTPESLAALKAGQAEYLEQPVVHDGQVITANGPEAAAEFAQAILLSLSSKPAFKA